VSLVLLRFIIQKAIIRFLGDRFVPRRGFITNLCAKVFDKELVKSGNGSASKIKIHFIMYNLLNMLYN